MTPVYSVLTYHFTFPAALIYSHQPTGTIPKLKITMQTFLNAVFHMDNLKWSFFQSWVLSEKSSAFQGEFSGTWSYIKHILVFVWSNLEKESTFFSECFKYWFYHLLSISELCRNYYLIVLPFHYYWKMESDIGMYMWVQINIRY